MHKQVAISKPQAGSPIRHKHIVALILLAIAVAALAALWWSKSASMS